MSEPAIQLLNVSKTFGTKAAVDGLSLDVPEGSVFGLLGANGAGKTTTIRMLVGHLHPSEGEVRVLGTDPWLHSEDMKRRVAYVSENMALPAWMTLKSAKRLGAKLYPAWDADLAETLASRFKLDGRTRFSNLSKGQKRSLCILVALCQNAKLLILDEPAAGLDTVTRRTFLEQLLDVACQEGRTILISSHILSDLERIVDRVAVLSQGTLTLEGELEDLKQGARKLHLPCEVSAEQLAAHFRVLQHRTAEGQTEASVLGFDNERFQAFCAERGCADESRQFGLNLEDLFVELMNSDTDTKRVADSVV